MDWVCREPPRAGSGPRRWPAGTPVCLHAGKERQHGDDGGSGQQRPRCVKHPGADRLTDGDEVLQKRQGGGQPSRRQRQDRLVEILRAGHLALAHLSCEVGEELFVLVCWDVGRVVTIRSVWHWSWHRRRFDPLAGELQALSRRPKMTHGHFLLGGGGGSAGVRGTMPGDVTPPWGFGSLFCERGPDGGIEGRCAKLCLPWIGHNPMILGCQVGPNRQQLRGRAAISRAGNGAPGASTGELAGVAAPRWTFRRFF